jgi:molybdate transport system substrate-binding protein
MKKAVLVLFLSFLGLPAFAADITVAAAANMQYPLQDLQAEFTKETGIGVKDVIGASGKLTAQAENGAPFDVFLSADMKYPARLYKDGFSVDAPKVYANGVLVLWTMKGIGLTGGINVLSTSVVQKIAMANPQVAPYGREAVNALKFYKLYGSLQKELVLGESISQTNQFITTGAADIGFTAESVVLSPNMKGKGQWVAVDPKSYKPIAQGVVVLKYGKANHAQEADAFYHFLFSPAARAILKNYGYNLP